MLKLTKSSTFLVGFYVSLLVWWGAISYYQVKNQPINLVFAFSYAFIPFLGGILGLKKAQRWGFFKSALGKALGLFSLGLIFWSVGEFIWSYYNIILHVAVPYPSWSDASFIVSWPLWGIGMYFLSFATGAKYGLKKKIGQLFLIMIPLVTLFVSYYVLVTIARAGSITSGGGITKVFFDFAYPIGDVVIITMTLIIYGLSFKYLGGRFKLPVIIILLGFFFNYLADFGFSYTTTVNTFYNGSWVDLLFTTAMFVLSFGINSFDIKDE